MPIETVSPSAYESFFWVSILLLVLCIVLAILGLAEIHKGTKRATTTTNNKR